LDALVDVKQAWAAREQTVQFLARHCWREKVDAVVVVEEFVADLRAIGTEGCFVEGHEAIRIHGVYRAAE
jgi:hypothetical protein